MPSSTNFSRSQAILRLPVDRMPAGMVLQDGSRSEVEVFLPLGDSVRDLLARPDPFLPMMRRERVHLVARSAIACLAVAEVVDLVVDALPIVHQDVQVHLRSGVVLEGTLRWLAPLGRQRTCDHLNEAAPSFELHVGGIVHHVVKAHVAVVEEL